MAKRLPAYAVWTMAPGCGAAGTTTAGVVTAAASPSHTSPLCFSPCAPCQVPRTRLLPVSCRTPNPAGRTRPNPGSQQMRTGALSLYSVVVITATLVAEALLAPAVALGVEAGVDDDGAEPPPPPHAVRSSNPPMLSTVIPSLMARFMQVSPLSVAPIDDHVPTSSGRRRAWNPSSPGPGWCYRNSRAG